MSNDTEKTVLALLGDEAAALGAIHAGLSAAYGYPGTPSTEILEYLIEQSKAANDKTDNTFTAAWCTNEKTAMEAALGTSFAGKRALVTMKHVGLNVASDPFMNGALLSINGGLVVAVADDPGMHSSQCEQDSRFYAAFAMVPCLEPRSQQETYDMCREAFEISEKYHVPVILRLVTRLSHARAIVKTVEPVARKAQNPLSKAKDKTHWMLLPVFARRNYADLIEKQKDLEAWSLSHNVNRLETEGRDASFAVITSGLGGNYYEENLEDLISSRNGKIPARLHIGAYPIPADSIRRLCENAEKVLVIEEGQPFIEERLRGILPQKITIAGRLDGSVPRTGELDPDNVRKSLGLQPRPSVLDGEWGVGSREWEIRNVERMERINISELPGRPPQLCKGCPHADSYQTINKAVAELDPSQDHSDTAVLSDIGCYSLGATPPYSAIESLVCMGASVGMARGAAEAGIKYALAVIGDSTFLHSGITNLIDAVEADAHITVIILDNSVVAMTGCQETIIPSEKLAALILGLGVKPEHLLELETKPNLIEENATRLKTEMEYPGLSVVIFKRECLEAFRKRRKGA
ncbi:MAG: indolepyruvate ferredoxin oxidoreductase [Treponema sp.]|jgi:indolepyruvate ferredoxin oxidoreductase alpha subunit|nr:indolepyruvate ferredoxin oxidoreductase [Treponema sp.]